MKGRRIIAVHGIRNKGQAIPARDFDTATERMKDWKQRHGKDQMKDPAFAERFERAGEAWDVALQLAALREKAGLSQKDLARKLKTSQQQVSRLESPEYEGHSLSMLRRVAEALGATIYISFESKKSSDAMVLSDKKMPYRVRKK
jgi:ribosome-binding protein aMBF1 (putative translation factor)